MAIVNDMSYRGITQRTAEWIGMAASVAGGYVAVNGPRIERIDAETIKKIDKMIDHWSRQGCEVDDMERDRAETLAGTHSLQGGDYSRVIPDGGCGHYVLCVPAGGPLADEGYSLPSSLVEELIPILAAAGYGHAIEA
jgi:hypothetical protein